MKNKALVYAVLAISLGYLLVSAVPSKLVSPMLVESGDDSEIMRTPVPGSAEPPKDSALAAAESAQDDMLSSGTVQEESLAAGSGSGKMIVSVFSTWSINLLIALGVYYFARRRFT